MHKIISFLLSNKKIHTFLRRLYDAHVDKVKVGNNFQNGITEVGPLLSRSSFCDEFRINLLVPALSSKHVFGGIATALKFLDSMGKGQKNLRIILTDEANFNYNDNLAYKDWNILDLGDEDQTGMCIVPAGDRYGKTIALGKNDFFITTAWWTSVLARGLQTQQNALFGLTESNKYIYLIQDYEPGFYPWSSRYALAESTYHDSDNYIAVFNSSVLKFFFDAEGYIFKNSYCFEPVLHERLRPYLKNLSNCKREKKILVYGRPSVDRNAFSIIVMALCLWVERTGNTNWVFHSAGEVHPTVDLGHGNILVSLGKLSIEEYAKELSSSFAGISLMVSPHPSYPPLEMAAFGVNVITNRYKSKNLSFFSKNIHSVPRASPEVICEKLIEITNNYKIEDDLPISLNPAFEYYCDIVDPFATTSKEILADLRDTKSECK